MEKCRISYPAKNEITKTGMLVATKIIRKPLYLDRFEIIFRAKSTTRNKVKISDAKIRYAKKVNTLISNKI